MAIVCIVTPADRSTKSVKAFKNELDSWRSDVTYKYFEAQGTNSDLASKAQNAVDASPDVIVTFGTMATNKVLAKSTSIPIVQAAGGDKVSAGNVTGFYLNAQQVCKGQFDKLNSQGNTPVAVLYDSKNDPSPPIYSWLKNYGGDKVNGVDINGDMSKLTAAALQGNNGFMLIPNALFYQKCKDIAKAVHQAGIQAAIYPEREYRKAHTNPAGKKVHGHSIPLTCSRAAYYVDSLLDDPTCINSLPFLEGIPDED